MMKKWLRGLIGLSILALCGRLLGFVREILMASKFGATEITDAYLTTLLLFDIAIAANSSILSGTLSYSTGIKNLSKISASLYKIGIKLFAAVFVVALILYPLTDIIIPLIFSKSTAAAQIVIETSRLFLILLAFLAGSGIFSALLQIKGNITNPGKLVIFLNVSSVVFLILFTPYFGILSLPLGLLFGGFLFFIYQIFLIGKTNFELRDNSENDKFNMYSWGTVVLLIFGNSLLPSLSGLLERYFAYSFAEGTFSHYQYAVKIIFLPLTIFSFAISTSLLPVQTKSINSGNKEEFINVTNNGILLSVITSAFFVLIFSTLSEPIIRLIYQHGRFTLRDSADTSLALQIMAIGLIPFLLNPVLANVFYSLGIVKKLIAINLFFILIQTGILFFLSKIFSGIETLTTTWVIIVWINNITLVLYLIRLKHLHSYKTVFLKLLLVLLITTAMIALGKNSIGLWSADIFNVQNNWSLLLKIVFAGFVLLFVFCLAVYFLFRDKFNNILANLKKSNK